MAPVDCVCIEVNHQVNFLGAYSSMNWLISSTLICLISIMLSFWANGIYIYIYIYIYMHMHDVLSHPF